MAKLLTSTFLLLLLATLLAANDIESRRQRRRRLRETPTSAAKDSCEDPSEKDLKKQLASEMSLPFALHHSFYQHEDLREAKISGVSLETFQKEKRGPVQIRKAPLDGSTKRQDCTPVRRQTSRGTIEDPCPISWVLNVDLNRAPRILVEGQCLPCSSCMSCNATSAGGSAPAQGVTGSPEDTPGSGDRSECSEVYYYTKVLRKTIKCELKTNKWFYEPVWERITVGCACRGKPSRAASDGIPTPGKSSQN